MLGCNNNDYQGMRYARARKHTRHRASRSRLDGIHLLPPVCPPRITSSGIPAGTMPPDRSLRQRKQRKHPAESTGIRSAPYPVAWQGNTEQCRKLKAAGLGIIKVFSIAREIDLRPVGCYEGICDYFLFDTACSDMAVRQNLQLEYPASLSGKNAFPAEWRPPSRSLSSLLQFKHEQWAGIDLNSGFETAPALKDAAAVHTFINQLKQKIQ